ncbi:hypothetical protein DPEC_G00204880 [Dallia pectoralis]|uniref:Uncharacterized protein n=1 Tax=Dallia pectoralis TaxID=75939 RepID=A0ACC2G4P5_DALPE|nr:hypothetical protein DPEC_G00204880 [Dallia pectoralis]
MDLKDITELVVAPVHSDDSLAFLEGKIIEHRQRYVELFPDTRLRPKHHYLEHYPQMIRLFGPVVSQWTMRFEAKHRFFKQVIRHTSCFKNVPLSLASKHQMMIAYHLSSPFLSKPDLEVSAVSTLPVDLLKKEIAQAIRHKFPDTNESKTAVKMGTPVILKIHLTDGTSQRLTLPHGLPASVDELMENVEKQCGLQGNFRLQFMDSLFGNEFLNLTSMSEVQDRAETEKSLEAMQKALLLDVKKRDNREVVKHKMEKTFAHRRHEVVRDAPMVQDFMARWPALFHVSEINAEFKRITTVPLQSKFLSQLDLYSDNLVKLFKKKGGQLGERLKTIIAQMADCDDVDAGWECIIKGVCIYMEEDPENLVKQYVLPGRKDSSCVPVCLS